MISVKDRVLSEIKLYDISPIFTIVSYNTQFAKKEEVMVAITELCKEDLIEVIKVTTEKGTKQYLAAKGVTVRVESFIDE